jgi:hypothetical protein
LPIGETAPRGSAVHFWQQYAFGARADLAFVLIGLGLAAAGAWLGLHPAPVTIGTDRVGYHLGTVVLSEVAPGVYGGDSAVVIREEDGQVRAAAAGKMRGEPMQGFCVHVAGTESEHCIFVVGRQSFHAVDRLDRGVWHRRYDNGRTVDIRLADSRHPTPVPIPVGWD